MGESKKNGCSLSPNPSPALRDLQVLLSVTYFSTSRIRNLNLTLVHQTTQRLTSEGQESFSPNPPPFPSQPIAMSLVNSTFISSLTLFPSPNLTLCPRFFPGYAITSRLQISPFLASPTTNPVSFFIIQVFQHKPASRTAFRSLQGPGYDAPLTL